MTTIAFLRHPVTILVSILITLDNLTDDLLILKLLTINESLAKKIMQSDRTFTMFHMSELRHFTSIKIALPIKIPTNTSVVFK